MNLLHEEVIAGGAYAFLLLGISLGLSSMGRSESGPYHSLTEFHPGRELNKLTSAIALLVLAISAAAFFGLGVRHWRSSADLFVCSLGAFAAFALFRRKWGRRS